MSEAWRRFREHLFADEALQFSLDISRMRFPEGYLESLEGRMDAAFGAMRELEAGAVANPDEERMVGHYWLRAPELAPSPEIRSEIESTFRDVCRFAASVHAGEVAPERGGTFRNLLLVGIGGSALGPQLLGDALGYAEQPMQPFFLDNTDPDGIDRVFAELGDGLAQTLTVVCSKSGGTKETRNGMLEAEARYHAAGLQFARYAVAITGSGSQLDRHAEAEAWLERFPMWDWVGGRTSVFSAVGLLPAALLGFDVEAFVRGGGEMDQVTRVPELRRNPAALLAAMWYHAGGGRGEKDMVVLPYKDRLLLFARYLQQLVMESLGKELDLEGRRVNQGIVVYGNKGSTDQHAYVQQLREGANNFFVTFIRVLRDRDGASMEVQPGATSGDYLHGFLLGTREALTETERESLTITLETVDAAALGRMIALFDRAVGLYAQLIGINAYHQPGVEAGKKAAEEVIRLQERVTAALEPGAASTAEEIAERIDAGGEVEAIYHVLRHLAANPDRGIRREPGAGPAEDRFSVSRK